MRLRPLVRVCLSTALIPQFRVEDYVVVVIDILRATTSFAVAMDRGISEIRPVRSLRECRRLGREGYLTAAERGAQKVPGFDFGNSPHDFLDIDLTGKKLAFTTTNGTRALWAVRHAKKVVTGAFVNMSVLTTWLRQQDEPVLLVCSGWKDQVNLEDTLFAGAIATELEGDFRVNDDATLIAMSLYQMADHRKKYYLEHSAHFERLIELGMQNDVKYSLRRDLHPVLPYYQEGRLINALAVPV
ncbi:MAG: 2-phosphosulfolactate phosphatase [Bacteroidia bacterium]|nr:2-phosphosulfolactate phosphatase [Bacteroidia bacterium]MCX7652613.1 2-phosphosulfolactate phosphatase [Bacteroidia bacterium]MDW8417034.1 2-phosphosulfolactate phosphatase [Bacteroidia bacterium]